MATTCKDKKIRIIDPRAGEVLREGDCHQGTKASKVSRAEFTLFAYLILGKEGEVNKEVNYGKCAVVNASHLNLFSTPCSLSAVCHVLLEMHLLRGEGGNEVQKQRLTLPFCSKHVRGREAGGG